MNSMMGVCWLLNIKAICWGVMMIPRVKHAVGEYWTHKSDGKCLFFMAQAGNLKGRNVFQQIQHVLSNPG
jgi:hypothetical protein